MSRLPVWDFIAIFQIWYICTFGITMLNVHVQMIYRASQIFSHYFNLPYFDHFVVLNKVGGILPFCYYPFFQIMV